MKPFLEGFVAGYTFVIAVAVIILIVGIIIG